MTLADKMRQWETTRKTHHLNTKGLLCRRAEGGGSQVLVPDALVQAVLRHHHGAPLLGHNGQSRVYELMKRRYHWPCMRRDVRDWVRGCQACQKRKTPRPMRAGLTRPMMASRPFQQVAIDIVGPFPVNGKGNYKIHNVVQASSMLGLST
jgi:hypothetical protein